MLLYYSLDTLYVSRMDDDIRSRPRICVRRTALQLVGAVTRGVPALLP